MWANQNIDTYSHELVTFAELNFAANKGRVDYQSYDIFLGGFFILC